MIKIISGGQTGADQGALFGAKSVGFETGGTAPKGYKTEVGPMPLLLGDTFGLVESDSDEYQPRTWKNVKDADLTIWMGTQSSPGYYCTMNAVGIYKKVCLKISKNWSNKDVEWVAAQVKDWAKVINFAGNRESKNHGIHDAAKNFIVALKEKLNDK